jgi:hypothetical protein
MFSIKSKNTKKTKNGDDGKDGDGGNELKKEEIKGNFDGFIWCRTWESRIWEIVK